MSINLEEQICVLSVTVTGMVVWVVTLPAKNTEYSDKVNASDSRHLVGQKMGNDYLVKNSVLNPASRVKT